MFLAAFCISLLAAPATARSNAQQPLRIMPLGDSITQGEDGHASYRYFLWHMLTRAGYRVDFVGSMNMHYTFDLDKAAHTGKPKYKDADADHEGHWGFATHHVLANIDKWAKAKPDIVLIHLGTNNPLPSAPAHRDIEKIIDALRKENRNVTVYLATLIPVRGFEKQIAAFNKGIPALARKKSMGNSPVIPVNLNNAINPQRDLQEDGLHPTENGCYLIAKGWFEAVERHFDTEARIKKAALTGNLAPLQRYMRIGDYGGISATVEGWIAGGRLRGEEVSTAAELLDAIAAHKDAMEARIDYLTEQKRIYAAYALADELRRQFRGTKVAHNAEDKIKRWQKSDAKSIKAATAMKRAGILADLGRGEQAAKLYEQVVKQASGTMAAKDAKQALDWLEGRELITDNSDKK